MGRKLVHVRCVSYLRFFRIFIPKLFVNFISGISQSIGQRTTAETTGHRQSEIFQPVGRKEDQGCRRSMRFGGVNEYVENLFMLSLFRLAMLKSRNEEFLSCFCGS